MTDFLSPDVALAAAIAAAAGLMRGFAGVGSGMLMAPFFVYILGPVATVGVIVLIEMAATVQLLLSVHRLIEWRVILPIALGAFAAMPVGTWALRAIDPAIMQPAVGVLVVAFAILLLSGWRYRGTRPTSVSLGVGGVSGILMALTSMGNPPVIAYLLASDASAERTRANFTGYFGVTLVALAAVMVGAGTLTTATAGTAAVLLPGFLLGVAIGAYLFRVSGGRSFREIVCFILLGAGLYAVARSDLVLGWLG